MGAAVKQKQPAERAAGAPMRPMRSQRILLDKGALVSEKFWKRASWMTTATSSCCRLEWYGRSHGSRFLDGDHCGGALAPLRWEDLDIETETGSVNKQTMKKMRTTTPGNGPSTRTLPGSPPSRIGSMYCPDSVAALHQRILRGPRLEHIRPHDLRHTVTPGPSKTQRRTGREAILPCRCAAIFSWYES